MTYGYSWLFFRNKPSVFEDPLPPGEQENRIAFLAVFLKLPTQNSHGLLVKPDYEDVAPDVLEEADNNDPVSKEVTPFSTTHLPPSQLVSDAREDDWLPTPTEKN